MRRPSDRTRPQAVAKRTIRARGLGIDLESGTEGERFNRKDLARRLQEFKGIGPVTTRIFLRDIKSLQRPPFRPRLAERSKTE